MLTWHRLQGLIYACTKTVLGKISPNGLKKYLKRKMQNRNMINVVMSQGVSNLKCSPESMHPDFGKDTETDCSQGPASLM